MSRSSSCSCDRRQPSAESVLSTAWFTSRSDSFGSTAAKKRERHTAASKRNKSLVPLTGLLTKSQNQQTGSLLPMQCNIATVAAVIIQMEMR